MPRLLQQISSLPLYFGGAAVSGEEGGYGFGPIKEGEAINLLKLAFDKGIKIYDTAPIYGFGSSEQRIGKAFNQYREKVFIISKSGVTWHHNRRVDMSNDPKTTRQMLEQSLRDLNTDYIDLFMVHWPDAKVDIRRPMEVLAAAKNKGLIKHIGLCNTDRPELEKATTVEAVEVVQSQLNLFERSTLELLPYLAENNISFMSWGTLDKGILTGTVNEQRKFDSADCRSWAPWWKQIDKQSRYDKMKLIKPILEKHGHTPLELALGHNLCLPELDGVLCGARTEAQLEGLFAALEHLPGPDLIQEIVELVEA